MNLRHITHFGVVAIAFGLAGCDSEKKAREQAERAESARAQEEREREERRLPLVRACEQRDGKACYRLAEEFESLRGDPAKAAEEAARRRALYRSACDFGHARGCYDLGMSIRGDAPQEGNALLKKGCDLDDATSCARLASIVKDGEDRRRFDAKALSEKACRLGDTDACRKGADRGDLHREASSNSEPGGSDRLTPAEKLCLAKHAEGARKCVKNQCADGRWNQGFANFAQCEAFCLVANIEAGKQDCISQ